MIKLYSGIITKFDTEKGFGFINMTESQIKRDVFYHKSQIVSSLDELREGMFVIFAPDSEAKKPRAKWVYIVKDESEAKALLEYLPIAFEVLEKVRSVEKN